MKRIAMYVAGSALLCFGLTVIVRGQRSDKTPGKWVSEASMHSPRSGACSVLLRDGRVLIAGGADGSHVLRNVEIFDADGSFSAVASMASGRSGHACAALEDGTVLVAGGDAEGRTALSSSEVYNPAADSWSAVHSMATPRAGATASLLKNGRVLIAGGETSGVALSTLEVYDPSSGAFTPVSNSLSSPREEHAAAILADGRVMIAGGTGASGVLDSVDVYDPATGAVTAGGKLSTPRAGLSITPLVDGKMLVAGGFNGSSDLASAELFDPETGTFSVVGSMAVARRNHSSFRLPDNNQVLVAGGTSGGVPLSAAELYVPWKKTFVSTGSLVTARSGAVGGTLRTKGRLVIAGGLTAQGASATAETLNFATITTDRSSYSPGQKVKLTGTGWIPGETVTLQTDDSNNHWTVVADASGKFTDSSFQLMQDDMVASHILIANGFKSDALTTVNTALIQTACTANGNGILRCYTITINPTSVLQNSTVTYTLVVTNRLDSGQANVIKHVVIAVPSAFSQVSNVNVTTPPSGWTVLPNPFSGNTISLQSGVGISPGQSLIVNVTATAPAAKPGTACEGDAYPWPLEVSQESTDNGNGNDFNLIGDQAVVTVYPDASCFIGTTLTLNSVSPDHVTVGSSGPVTIAATLNRSDTNAPLNGEPVQFFLGGAPLGSPVTTVNGVATLSNYNPSSLLVGSYTVEAGFAGDPANKFAASNSNTLTLVVDPAATAITVTTNPAGLQIAVDGTTLTAPQTFNWAIGSTHTINTPSPQSGAAGIQYLWTNWSDSGTQSHTITTPSAGTTYTANFKTQYQVSFAQNGIDTGDGTGTVVTVSGAPIALGSLPYSQWADSGSSVTFSYANPVASTVPGKQYALQSASATSPLTVSAPVTVTGTYKAQVQVTFAQSGITDGAGTIVTVAGSSIAYSSLPYAQWFNVGDPVTFAYASPAASTVSGKQYTLQSVSTTSPLTASAPATVTGTYTIQYQVIFAQSGIGLDGTGTVVTVGATTVGFGSLPYTQWVNSGDSVAFSYANPVSSTVAGKQYAFQSASSTSPLTVSAPVTVTGTYKAQVQVTFDQSGIGADGTGTVVTVAGTPVAYGSLPYTQWFNVGDSVTFGYTNPVASTTSGKQYALQSVSAASPLTVSVPATVTGTYKGQAQLTFAQSGIIDGTGTVVIVGATPVAYGSLPYTQWFNIGDSVSFTYASPASSTVPGKQYILQSVSTTSPLTVSAAATVTGAYTVQYQVTFAQTGIGPDGTGTVVTVGATPVALGSLPYKQWVNSGDSLAFSYANPVASTVTGKQYAFQSASAASPLTVSAPVTVTGTYKAQVQVTFAQSGIGADGTGTVVTVAGTPVAYSGLPNTQWFNVGDSLAFSYASSVASGTPAKQYALQSVSTASPLAVSAPLTVTGTYAIQFQVTFAQSGITDGTGTVVTVAGTPVAYSSLPYTKWFNSGDSVAFAYADPAASTLAGKQYSLKSVSTSSPLTVSAATTVTGTYAAQFRLTFAQSGITDGTGTIVTVAGSPIAYGSLPYSQWVNSGDSVAFAYVDPAASTVAGKQYSLKSVSAASPVTVSAPTTVTGTYTAQYLLTLAITAGVPGGLGNISGATSGTYYAAGTLLNLVATTPIANGAGQQYRLNNWSGTTTGSSATLPVTMNAPQSITANYALQYLVTFTQTGLDADATGTILTVNGSPKALPYSGYFDAASVVPFSYSSPVASSVTGKRYLLTSTSPAGNTSVTVSSPSMTVTGNYKTQFYLTVTMNPAALLRTNATPVDGWYDASASVTLTAAATVTGLPGAGYIFRAWSGDVPSSPNTADPLGISMTQARSVVANYTTWQLAWTAANSFTAQYSDPTKLQAILTADGVPVPSKSISFSVGTDTGSALTASNGVATDGTLLTQPAGPYTAGASCSAAVCGIPLSITNPFTIALEDVSFTYTGDSFVMASKAGSSTTAKLSALVQEAADGNIGSKLNGATAAFTIYKYSDTAMSSPVTSCTSPVSYVSLPAGTGTAGCTVSLTADNYVIEMKLLPNPYYIDPVETPVLTVGDPGTGMTTGGGWLTEPTIGTRSNFGFTVKYQKNGSVQGNSLYIYRVTTDLSKLPSPPSNAPAGVRAYNWIIKSNQMDALGQACSGTPTICTSTFTGKNNITAVDRLTGIAYSLGGNYQFQVDVTDNGEPGAGPNVLNPDKYAIRVWNSNGNYYMLGTYNQTTNTAKVNLEGGNIQVHLK